MSRLDRSRFLDVLAGATLLSACGKDDASPSAPSSANGVPTVSAATSPSTTALATSTVVTFTASGNDPDGDTLTYNWTFRNSKTASDASVTHVYRSAGTYT